MKNKIICIVGPTASGKTALSIELAKLLNGEIISADSCQIYKNLNVGTAKPSEEEKAGIRHHMLDVCEIYDEFSASEYVLLADACICDIINRGKIPIVVGGTGLYVNALIDGNSFGETQKDEEFRKKLEKLALENSNEFVHKLLEEVDEESANKIHPNNLKRVIRALEVFHLTGKTMTQKNIETKKPPRYDAVIIGISPINREILYERINLRVSKMLEDGIVSEAKILKNSENASQTALQAIGYKELFPYIDGEESLESCLDKIRQASRNYAKRQLTWFRRDERINWIFYKENENLKNILQNSTRILEENNVK